MIAPLSKMASGPPSASSSTIAGILLLGEMRRKSGANCSFALKSTGTTR